MLAFGLLEALVHYRFAPALAMLARPMPHGLAGLMLGLVAVAEQLYLLLVVVKVGFDEVLLLQASLGGSLPALAGAVAEGRVAVVLAQMHTPFLLSFLLRFSLELLHFYQLFAVCFFAAFVLLCK